MTEEKNLTDQDFEWGRHEASSVEDYMNEGTDIPDVVRNIDQALIEAIGAMDDYDVEDPEGAENKFREIVNDLALVSYFAGFFAGQRSVGGNDDTLTVEVNSDQMVNLVKGLITKGHFSIRIEQE